MSITGIVNLIIPLAQLYLLWKIYRLAKPLAEAEETKKEINDTLKKFGSIFADTMEIPKPPTKKKVVSFEAIDTA